MGMNMHEQRRLHPTSTVVLEASLLICQTNSLVTTLLEHQLFFMCLWIEHWYGDVSAS
ncbi:hypothetical protein SAMN04488689_101254 [Paenibacillus sp. cl6col]|nr:hypothetical protein SAMN04488689_101254 [Paenibacillus sp. cl6col]